MSSRIVSFTARDEVTGDEVTAEFTEAAQIVSFNEDGSIQAKVIYMEGAVNLVLNFELDIKSLLPAPSEDQLRQQEDFFSAWRNPSYSGPPTTSLMTKMPGGR